MGYYVPGFSEIGIDKVDEHECTFYLSSHDMFICNSTINQNCNSKYGQQMVLQLLNEPPMNVPIFTIIYADTMNDKYLREMVENIDKSNTILNIISDSGGQPRSNIFGYWESKNPVNIMLIPSRYTYDNLKLNQQKYINHFDINLFYKEFMLNLMESSNNINGSMLSKYKKLVYENQPISSKSILNEIISNDRSCDFIDKGYCFCDIFRKSQMTKELVEDNVPTIKLIIDKINKLTQTGDKIRRSKCEKLNADKFELNSRLVNNDGYINLMIHERVDKKSKHDGEEKRLAYSAVIMPSFDPKINDDFEIKNIVKISDYIENCDKISDLCHCRE